ncbi:MAG TPA: PLDc N-terminal domain-containing protein [Puia sp.]|nr:PLDc N-terminal domain-containing protein [Puia sp.]
MLSFLPPSMYLVSIVLQAICVIHCLAKGNQQKWIWVIIFLPFIGCVLYFFTEIVNARNARSLSSGLGGMVNPLGRIKRLENNLLFTDTFNNRVMLADAYLAAGRTDEAIGLYTSSLTGAFTENEYVMKQLIRAYFEKQRYTEVILMARKLYGRPQFARSKEHILYARALVNTGDPAGAEQEFMKMKARFADFEARYQYGLFLRGAGREKEARLVFEDITGEASHLSSRERRDNRAWIAKAKDELKKTPTSV